MVCDLCYQTESQLYRRCFPVRMLIGTECFAQHSREDAQVRPYVVEEMVIASRVMTTLPLMPPHSLRADRRGTRPRSHTQVRPYVVEENDDHVNVVSIALTVSDISILSRETLT